MADDDDQRAPFLPMQGRWNLEMSGEHVHPYIGHNSSKDSKKYSIYTLRSVNDVTEGSTQEAHMCASYKSCLFGVSYRFYANRQ